MIIRGIFHLKFKSNVNARQVLQSISPDNKPLPSGMSLVDWVDDDTIHFEITMDRGIESLTATVEDLLGSVDIALRVIASLDDD